MSTNRSIPAHRLAKRRLVLKDAQGRPLQNRNIHAELTKHKFLFGCGAFETLPLMDPATPESERKLLQTYWDAWRELFNYGTLPFYWGRYEPTEGHPDDVRMHRAAEMMVREGVTAKGHPLCWHTACAKWLLPKSNDEVLHLLLERVTREVTGFKGTVDIWDGVNEMVIMPVFEKEDNAITRLCQKMGRVPLAKAVFDTARQANLDAKLLLNDFVTTDDYLHVIEDCLAGGVGIDIIGIQSHQHQGPWGLEKLQRVVERFEKIGLPLHFTENTFISGELMPPDIVDLNDFQVTQWPSTPKGEDDQARWVLEMADFLFARPSVHAFTSWDLVDDCWLHAPAGLLRVDGSRKPAYEALKQRVWQDWATRADLHTDENGVVELEGVKGDYALTCEGGKVAFTLDCAEGDLALTVQ